LVQVLSTKHLDSAALLEAGWKDVDAVVFGPNPSLSDSFYDAQLVADIMVLQQYYADAGCSQRLHLVAPARDPFTAPVVNHVLLDFGAAQRRLAKVDPETRLSNISEALNKSIGDAMHTGATDSSPRYQQGCQQFMVFHADSGAYCCVLHVESVACPA
jgi:hypothetical protein